MDDFDPINCAVKEETEKTYPCVSSAFPDYHASEIYKIDYYQFHVTFKPYSIPQKFNIRKDVFLKYQPQIKADINKETTRAYQVRRIIRKYNDERRL